MTGKGNWTITITHFLVGCRFDKLMKLYRENRSEIPVYRMPQALLLAAVSLLLFPFAMLEELICRMFVYRKKVKTPVFILGHWRSGTTYLHNLMSLDERFAFFDAVTTYTNNNALLLHRLSRALQKKVVPNARPMDNVEYESDSPSEECFAVANLSAVNVVHMLVFPKNCRRYLKRLTVSKCSQEEIADWKENYRKVVSKVSFLNGGKHLLLKSPDNTCHVKELLSLYPHARFVHIYRTPYKVIPSTIHMIESACGFLALQDMPEREELEDIVIELYKTVYTQYLEEKDLIPRQNLIEISYEEFVREPEIYLEKIYKKLRMQGYETVRPKFEAYIQSQKNYKTNKLELSDELLVKINHRLDFAFKAFGYEKVEEV